MFDVGFFELLLIGVVALLVVGPERLPKLARTAGMWFSRARRMLSSVKQDIEEEVRADELRRVLEQNKITNPLEDTIEQTRHSFSEIHQETESAINAAQDKSDPAQPSTTPKQS